MDDLRLAIMQIVHCNCNLYGNPDPGFPRDLDISASMEQLEEVATFAIVDEQIVFILLLRYCNKRHQILVFLDPY